MKPQNNLESTEEPTLSFFNHVNLVACANEGWFCWNQQATATAKRLGIDYESKCIQDTWYERIPLHNREEAQ